MSSHRDRWTDRWTHTHTLLHATVPGSHLLYYLVCSDVHIGVVIENGLYKLDIGWYILVSHYTSFIQLLFIVSLRVLISAGSFCKSKWGGQNNEKKSFLLCIDYIQYNILIMIFFLFWVILNILHMK